MPALCPKEHPVTQPTSRGGRGRAFLHLPATADSKTPEARGFQPTGRRGAARGAAGCVAARCLTTDFARAERIAQLEAATAPAPRCTWMGPISKLEQHFANECPQSLCLCPHAGCAATFLHHAMALHADQHCMHRPAECQDAGCQTIVTVATLGAHAAECGFAAVTCDCGNVLTRSLVDVHEKLDCPLTAVQCPCYGCTARVKRNDLKQHLLTIF